MKCKNYQEKQFWDERNCKGQEWSDKKKYIKLLIQCNGNIDKILEHGDKKWIWYTEWYKQDLKRTYHEFWKGIW